MTFMIHLFEVVLIVCFTVFFVLISLSDGSVVNFIFIWDWSDYFSEEGFLHVLYSIHNC